MSHHDLTVNLIRAALDANYIQQMVVSNNIANANTLGYRPKKVDFQNQLQAIAQGAQSHLGQPVIQEVEGQYKVNIPQQMAQLSQNEMAYRSMITGLNQHNSILESAIMGGNK